MTHAPTEAAATADFTRIRYAQCWEDADVLLAGLNIQKGDVCLSIASAGDNSFSLLTADPAKVIAVDLNPAQLACCELRKAAYRVLDHEQFLQLIGSRPSLQRHSLYQKCNALLPEAARRFWDERGSIIEAGIGTAGKFEDYFTLFRNRVMPLLHSRATVNELFVAKPIAARREFYRSRWNTWRWRLMFKLFFSRRVMGRFGRDPAFFNYVEGCVADRIFLRADHALTELDPADNPYLQWILLGRHSSAVPHALRLENYSLIRDRLDRIEFHLASIEDYLAAHPEERIDRFNLSDIFEYMSPDNYDALLRRLLDCSRPGGRLAYWNMLVPRSRPEALAPMLKPLGELSARLLLQDKAFFYSRFVVEEVA